MLPAAVAASFVPLAAFVPVASGWVSVLSCCGALEVGAANVVIVADSVFCHTSSDDLLRRKKERL